MEYEFQVMEDNKYQLHKGKIENIKIEYNHELSIEDGEARKG
jgi:hypothetical protein